MARHPNAGRKEQYTEEQVAQALRETKGMVSLTAKKLGCDPSTIYNYIEKYPALKQVRKDARNEMLDALELKAYDRAMKGDTTMTIFLLKTQGKDRGYIERSELTGKDGEQLATPIIFLPQVTDDNPNSS